MRKLFERRFAAETLGHLSARKSEIERLDGGPPANHESETLFERALTKLREHRCGGGRRIIKKGLPKD